MFIGHLRWKSQGLKRAFLWALRASDGMLSSRFLFSRLLLHVFPKLGQLVLKALSYNGTRLPRILLNGQRSLSSSPLLTVLEAFQGVSAFILGNNKHRSLHLQCQLPKLQKRDPGRWLKNEQFLHQAMRDGLSALFCDGSSPHLQGLPSPEPVKELQGLDLHIQRFLLEPLRNIKKRVWFPSYVLAKSLLTDRVVLKTIFPLVLPDQLKIDQFQLIDVFLTSPDQVQKLVNVIHSSKHQTHVFIQFRFRDLLLLHAEIDLLLFLAERKQLGLEVASVSSDGIRAIEGGKSSALVVLRRGGRWEQLFGALADLKVLASLGHFRGVRGLKLKQMRFRLFLTREWMFREHVSLRTSDGIEQRRVAAWTKIESHLEQPSLEIRRFDYLFPDGRLSDINGCLLGHFQIRSIILCRVTHPYIDHTLCNKIVMGGKESSMVRWPVISQEHWHEVTLPSTNRRKVAHGQYKLLVNALTNQRIQQYGIVFQNAEEMEQYLQSFGWRQRQEHIINTRYFQPVKEESFCGSRIYARVYIQHTPYRLSSINDIPLPENLYILCSALLGFQKLHALIGYFKPNEEMLGIDCEGRLKVWLNSDFSRNYLFGPHYYQGIAGEQSCTEEKMVCEVVNMVEENTAYEHCRVPRLAPFLANKSPLTFSSAYQQVLSYAKRFNISIPKYFVSLVNLLQQRNNFSEDSKQSSVSVSEGPFKVSESNIRDNRMNVVYYMDPSLDSSQAVVSNQQKEPAQEIKIEQECIEMPADTTGETFIKNSYSCSTQVKTREFQKSQLPRIIFNYSSKDISTPTQECFTSFQGSRYTTTPQFHLPLSRIAEHKFQESVEQTRRLTYSDNHEDYFLDEELVDDMAKYLN